MTVASTTSAFASAGISYNFNTAGELAANFNNYVSSGTIAQLGSGGINDSGDVDIDGSANGVFASKAGFSIGPVGSTYVFTSHVRSVGGDGYSGMGFTTTIPDSTNASGYPYRPDDALGISVHGGGFVFSDGAHNYESNWDAGGMNAAINSVTTYPAVTLLENGSASKWFFVRFTATRDTLTTFDTKVEVWPCDASGANYNSDPSAVFEFNDRAATALINAPVIYAYFNLSGNRVYDFDDFTVNLDGGVSVIDEGNPVVLTDEASETSGALSMDGTVTDDGGASVTDYGFVYDTSADPTTSDTQISVGSGTGGYSGTSAVLANGTYHVRAYATNSNGTSYGADVEVTITAGSSGGGGGDTDGGGSGGTDSSSLAATGPTFDVSALIATGAGLIALGAAVRRRVRR
jgi:hypothetical protein